MALWILLTTSIVAAHGALEATYQWTRQHVPVDFSPLSLSGTHRLADYSISLTMMTSAVYAAFVVSFRRHKIDDYRGRYRMWYYVCGSFILAAVVTGAQLTPMVSSMFHWLIAAGGLHSSATWGRGILIAIGLAFGTRLLVEMRDSRSAISCLLAALLLALIGIATASQWLTPPGAEFRQMIHQLASLASSQLLLLSVVLYARHVYLDAQGLRTARRLKTHRRLRLWKQSPDTPEGDDAKPRVSRQSKRAAAPASKISANETTSGPSKHSAVVDPADVAEGDTTEDEEGDDEMPSTVKMSRSDRRRRRKDKRRQQQRAA